MVRVAKESSASPERKQFNTNDFKKGENVLFFDDKTNKWKVGEVDSWTDPVMDKDGKLCGIINALDGGAQNVKLTIPPKKVGKIPTTVEINGNIYNVDLSKTTIIQDTGEVEVTLQNAANAKDKLKNINLKTIQNLESVESFEKNIDAEITRLKGEVVTKADSRAKNILEGLAGLKKKLEATVDKLGSLTEWSDIGDEEAGRIGKEIAQQQADIQLLLKNFEKELKDIQPRKGGTKTLAKEAVGLQDRLNADVEIESKALAAKNTKEVADYNADMLLWKKDKVKFDKDTKTKEDWDAAATKRGTDPGFPPAMRPEPTKPETLNLDRIKNDEANKIFADLEASTTVNANFKAIVKEVKDRVDAIAVSRGFTDYLDAGFDKYRTQEIGKTFQAVLDEEKAKVPDLGEKFDLNKEKEDLKLKIKAIVDRATAAGMKTLGGKTIDKFSEDELKAISDIAPADPKKPDDDIPAQEKSIIDKMEEIRERDLEVFTKEQEKASKSERAETERDIDIPDVVLRELFSDRSKDVRSVMELIYNEKLKAGDESTDSNDLIMEGMIKLMKREPSDALLKKLRQYGIKNWDQFRRVWSKGMAKKAAGVLHEWGQADLQSEMSKQVGTWETVKALKWQLGARIAVNMGAIGVGVAAATAMFATGGLAGIGLAAAGGAAGGGIRAMLQKFIFGSKTMEDRKKKLLEEMYANKRTEIINSTLDKRFGGGGNKLSADTNALFSSIMAEAIRKASEDNVKGSAEDFGFEEADALKGDSKRLYIQALKNAREAGMDISSEQKIKVALALQTLIDHSKAANAEAIKNTDPKIIKILDGVMAGYSGTGASRENYGKKGAAATILTGAAVGTAFFSNSAIARGVLGGIGGGLAGYRFGEGRIAKKENAKAEAAFMPRFNQATEQWNRYFKNPNSLKAAELKQFGDEIKILNRYLKGEADTMDEKNIVAYLQSNPQLRSQTENLIYQAYRRGVFARIGLAQMQKHSEEAMQESNIALSDRDKAKWAKAGWRTLYTAAGAVAFGALAVGAGYAVQEIRGHYAVPPRADTTALDAKLAAAANAKDMSDIPNRNADLHYVGDTTDNTGAGGTGGGHHDVAPVAPTPDVIPPHQAGLIEAPSHPSGFGDWRHQIMEKMGYRFHDGKIDHALQFHPGAKIILSHADGTPVMDKSGNVVEYNFKHGGSTWDALDHLKGQANGMLKAGEVPTIKIVGGDTGKVVALENYRVESHVGGKTVIEAAPTKAVPHFDDLPNNNFDAAPKMSGNISEARLPQVKGWTADNIAVRGGDHKLYIPIYPDNDNALVTGHASISGGNHIRYVDHAGHIYDSHGKFVQNIDGSGNKPAMVEKVAAANDNVETRIKWTGGSAVENRNGLDSMLKSTPAGKSGVVEAPHLPDAKGGTVVPPVENPTVGFAGHEAQYHELQSMRFDIVSSLKEGALATDVSGDAYKVLPNLMQHVEAALSKNPGLLDTDPIKEIMDPNVAWASDARLLQLVTELDHGHNIILTPEERLLMGEDFATGDEFVALKGVDVGGVPSNVLVSTDGSHAVIYENPNTGARRMFTDPDTIFDKDHYQIQLKARIINKAA